MHIFLKTLCLPLLRLHLLFAVCKEFPPVFFHSQFMYEHVSKSFVMLTKLRTLCCQLLSGSVSRQMCAGARRGRACPCLCWTAAPSCCAGHALHKSILLPPLHIQPPIALAPELMVETRRRKGMSEDVMFVFNRAASLIIASPHLLVYSCILESNPLQCSSHFICCSVLASSSAALRCGSRLFRCAPISLFCSISHRSPVLASPLLLPSILFSSDLLVLQDQDSAALF